MLEVTRGGFYQWLDKPESDRAIEDRRLLGLIRDSYDASGGVYGARRVLGDLREAGEVCGKHRVEKIMHAQKIKAIRGYKAPRRIVGRREWTAASAKSACGRTELEPSIPQVVRRTIFPEIEFATELAYYVVYRPERAALPRLTTFRDRLFNSSMRLAVEKLRPQMGNFKANRKVTLR